MPITAEQYRILKERMEKGRLLSAPKGAVRARGLTDGRDRGMNKAESAYAKHLDHLMSKGDVVRYRFESIKLRLADRTYITMDFMVQRPDGIIEFHDVKAWWKKAAKVGIHDDAMVKMKVAAEQYPEWVFKAVWERNGTWNERVF